MSAPLCEHAECEAPAACTFTWGKVEVGSFRVSLYAYACDEHASCPTIAGPSPADFRRVYAKGVAA